MKKGAKLSKCRQYRYALWRVWDDSKPSVLFIGLNPSTADETADDPTLIRCINYSKKWDYGGVCMANLFAYRATSPSDMMRSSDPVGSENDAWLLKLAKQADIIVAAWGNDGGYLNRSTEIRKKLPDLHYMKMNKSGEPAHPLYLKGDLKPVALTDAGQL